MSEHNQRDDAQVIKDLAAQQQVVSVSTGNTALLEHLPAQAAVIQAAYKQFSEIQDSVLARTGAAEWLLDNYYLVQQTQQQIQQDLPESYYNELPRLDSGIFAGYPRVYALAHQIVSLAQAKLNTEWLLHIIENYQHVTPLTMGETWALPTLLRFCLLEILTQAIGRLYELVPDDPQVAPALRFTLTITDTEIVAAVIPALHLLNNIDWKDFFETVSHVEQHLRRDPAHIYAHMDFDSHNRYRRIIEDLARGSGHHEIAVVQYALELAQHAYDAQSNSTEEANGNAANGNTNEWRGLHVPVDAHIGYYLQGDGRSSLEDRLTYTLPMTNRFRRWIYRHAVLGYTGTIGLLALAVCIGGVLYAAQMSYLPLLWGLVLLVLVVPAISATVQLINWGITHTLPPHVLPKLDFQDGVPSACHTVVAVPALLSSHQTVQSLVTQLEQHYLRNLDSQISFALLTDFTDAPQETMPDDEALLNAAQAGIHDLNQRYPDQPFYLFHRPRLWNAGENVWMGWERKRGKLHQFNQFLLNGDDDDNIYTAIVGDTSDLYQVQYVITLDADTILPYDSARRLIGTLAHPLNRAQFAPDSNRVINGYTVLQPRIEIMPASINANYFTRLFADRTGIDLYTLAVSDVYQDLFGEGIYAGKGIYDVEAFERSLDNRVPDNSLLSHDLFEGIQGRSGLITDVIFYEDFPPSYLAYAWRMERWIRGDWQLIPWLLFFAPRRYKNHHQESTLTFLDRWKVFDNLRRSLLQPAFWLLFVSGWLWLPGSSLVWTLIALVLSAVLFLTEIIDSAINQFDATIWRSLRRGVLHWLFWLAIFPYEAWLAIRAITLTLQRVFITRKHLLQWKTAAATSSLAGENLTLRTALAYMWGMPLVSVVLSLLILWINPTAIVVAVPLLLLWSVSPVLVARTSQTTIQRDEPPTTEQQQALRMLARRTWLYFEYFVGPDDNWLPPDHYQEMPRETIAHRTSPTNIGLYLLSVLAAYDAGYIDAIAMSARLRSTFDTLARLEKYRGHFYNWIDTQNLHTLQPAYISTVDSGNLATSLIALKQGCHDISEQMLLRQERWQGLIDLLHILAETVADTQDLPTTTVDEFQAYVLDICQRIEDVTDKRDEWLPLLQTLSTEDHPVLDQMLLTLVDAGHIDLKTIQTLRLYTRYAHQHITAMQREYSILTPWLAAQDQSPTLFTANDISSTLQEAWNTLQSVLQTDIKLSDAADLYRTARHHLETIELLLDTEIDTDNVAKSTAIDQARSWCSQLKATLRVAETMVNSILNTYGAVAYEAHRLVDDMNFTFLFDTQRQVFRIGFNLDTNQLDPNAYDLLASEARLASLVAIAKRDVPQSHWLHLSRPLTRLDGELVLLSWSGTLFEYLMPSLLAHDYDNTLLTQSCRAVVDAQIAYGKQHSTPWGISESGYYAFDTSMNHQYRAFGMPGTGFKRGLDDDLVIAPYASLLALPFRASAVLQNLSHLQSLNAMSRYGLYESLDYTRSRLDVGKEMGIVQSHMAHHQGMIMVALLNHLHGNKMVQRFHADPWIQSVALLLQEQIPQNPQLQQPYETKAPPMPVRPRERQIQPWHVPLDTPSPSVHYLSNGRYATLISNNGGGYSEWQGTALTRWRADTTRDNWGYWIYIKDLKNGMYWSAGRHPAGQRFNQMDVQFYPHMVEFLRHDHHISVDMQITVAPDDDVEIRQIQLTNESNQKRHLRLTSYAEIVLTALDGDRRHPAFAKLFVESEYLDEYEALLFRRRPRSSDEEPIFLLHMLLTNPEQDQQRLYETDRARFLGRYNSVRYPDALTSPADDEAFTQTVGATLDPIMALGQDIQLAPYASTRLVYITAVATSRRKVLNYAQRYQNRTAVENAFSQAEKQARNEMQELALTIKNLEAMQKILSALVYPYKALRASADVIAANRLNQSALWYFGISGDYPMLLVEIADEKRDMILVHMLHAHTYWRRHGLTIDLIILNRQTSSYGQPVDAYIRRLVQHTNNESQLGRRGGIFVLRRDQMTDADYTLLQTTSRVVLSVEGGTLSEQLAPISAMPMYLPQFRATTDATTLTEPTPVLPRPSDLLFDNERGGFSPDGREYVIYLRPGEHTPAPWVNVIANPMFGFIVSESGFGSTWAMNSGENRLTTWNNDPVSDYPAEAIYLRDEETADIWSPTPQPCPADAPYLVRHGAGYSTFTHHSHGLKQHVRVFAAPDEPLKIVQLRIENVWQRSRRITVTYYAEWVLGTDRDTTQLFVVPQHLMDEYALLAHNPYSMEFSERVAFLAASKPLHGLTADRTEFLGQNGSYQRPAALERIGLDNRVQAGLDPCAVLQLHLDLAPNSHEDVYFLTGQGATQADAQHLIQHFQRPENVEAAWQAVQHQWDSILNTIQVDTPDTALNVLLNQWLLYQSVSSRLWGRSAFYQSSGAYGFRDQLQDVLALFHARPDLAREHILRAAEHQFEEGDVLHWWHPPSGRGVRTRISDDLLWLPYVTAQYIAATDDDAILDERVPFLRGEMLPSGEDEHYGEYTTTEESYSLYEHCWRAIQKASTTGVHELPLIGSGDWNDGMNRVGIEGKGESIWLGWFLYTVLTDFAKLCQLTDHTDHALQCQQQAATLQEALDMHGWDGNWYRRAYFDDGTPLGSEQNDECYIDAIAQAWSVLSGAAPEARAEQAMDALLKHLIQWDERLILLLTPPFDKIDKDPGYIKGYLPGIRENGGQYTHAALWTIWAFAKLGKGNLAYDLFRLINPVYRADTREKIQRYRVEPYVISADVYAVAPHTGRGGWTWYTGSASWMYRVGIEMLLGIRRTAAGLVIDPSIPAYWQTYNVIYRHEQATYHIHIENPHGVSQGVEYIMLDGERLDANIIPWLDDGETYSVTVHMAAQS